MNERLAIGERPPPAFEEIFQLAKEIELEGGMAIEDGGVREKLADWYVDGRGVTLTRFRSLTALSRGQDPGPENSIGKAITGKIKYGTSQINNNAKYVDPPPKPTLE